MTKLIVTRGLPASGKTTLAKQSGLARVNRDDLRAMLHGGVYSKENERVVRSARNKLVSTALLAGRDVIVDDTGLESKTMRDLHVLAWTHGVEFVTWDLCHVPLATCLERDAARIAAGERGVGETVIRSMAQRAKLPPEGGVAPAWTPETTEPLVPFTMRDARRPWAVLCDIDGTAARMAGRSPYDYSRVSTDVPNLAVIHTLAALRLGAMAPKIIFLSGRPDSCESDTEAWLDEHVGFWDELHMRAAGDTRNDAVIKYELFNAHVRDRFNVRLVLDDRDRVVRLWRTGLKLPTFQVNDGDF